MKLVKLTITSDEESLDNAKIIYLGNWCKKIFILKKVKLF